MPGPYEETGPYSSDAEISFSSFFGIVRTVLALGEILTINAGEGVVIPQCFTNNGTVINNGRMSVV